MKFGTVKVHIEKDCSRPLRFLYNNVRKLHNKKILILNILNTGENQTTSCDAGNS